jgi:hypothetical protein
MARSRMVTWRRMVELHQQNEISSNELKSCYILMILDS